MKYRVLYQCSYGSFSGLPDECKKYLLERGIDVTHGYPYDWRTNQAFIDMFDKFCENVGKNGKTFNVLYGILGKTSMSGYLACKEIDSDEYIIVEYDGSESVKTKNDFKWIKVSETQKNKSDD